MSHLLTPREMEFTTLMITLGIENYEKTISGRTSFPPSTGTLTLFCFILFPYFYHPFPMSFLKAPAAFPVSFFRQGILVSAAPQEQNSTGLLPPHILDAQIAEILQSILKKAAFR